ncbi:hypothetical protein [Natronoglycomyces albus]|uniref:Cupin domain-containing protein n=1 Tax=Natronoglycomyces albus TaxID=2811108 RepID=A0A895XQ03_9ACTN|nr:hypothetical protein [Natronoglycomyces albus]QSB05449.1 hypothetical protein JQS30_00435 [Natronoglycomyces albus]
MTNNAAPTVRKFDTAHSDRTTQLPDHRIRITPAVEATEGGPLSAYGATFGQGERAKLPAPYEEVWVIVRGLLRLNWNGDSLTVGAGEYLHVPRNSPGEVEALEETTLVCVSVPAH